MTGRVPFGVAAAAGRESFALARQARCSLEEHVVLEAIVSLTALESMLSRHVTVAEVAERARVHPKNAARALRRLRDLGVIDYTAGLGRGISSTIGLPSPAGAVMAPLTPQEKGSRIEQTPLVEPPEKREPPVSVTPAPVEPAPEPTSEPEPGPTAVGSVTESPEAALARLILDAFNERAGTDHRFDAWSAPILQRIAERPDWTIAEWRDVVRRAFAVAWWEKRLAPGEAPTPAVIFSSARQVDSTINVPDRVVERAERDGA